MRETDMSEINEEIRERLFALQDLQYKKFNAKLMPTVDPDTVIGVRTPELRALAKEFARREDVGDFLRGLPHHYFEENNLHAFILSSERDYTRALALVDAFLPCVDNWATCDQMCPKSFAKHKAELRSEIRRWLASGHAYAVRFGVGMLMTHYLGDAFEPQYLDWAAALRSDEYYVNMMVAWYFATALAKRYDAALPYIEERRLGVWTHNKAIQKALESDRVTDERKAYLRTLKATASVKNAVANQAKKRGKNRKGT